MPNETENAVIWALMQTDNEENLITSDNPHLLVDKVREYFNVNNIEYETFSYDDLIPFLQVSE